MSQNVTLALYDISQGMAKGLSMMLIGKQIDALYHSSIIVYGREYYFGGGICNDTPQHTPYGNPIQKINMGNTQIPKQVFEQFLNDIAPRFTTQKYDIIEHNCNKFTDEACQFLVGKGIPSKVLNQAKEILDTPLGKNLKPFLMQMQGSVQNPSPGMFK